MWLATLSHSGAKGSSGHPLPASLVVGTGGGRLSGVPRRRSTMRRARHTTTLATTVGLLICAPAAVAEGPQDDLVGRWKGYRMVRTPGGRGGQEKVSHSFTITAVKEAAGKWEADAVDWQGQPLPMTVSVIEGVVHVEYRTARGLDFIHLKLQNGTVLRGEARRSGVDLDVRLEKQ